MIKYKLNDFYNIADYDSDYVENYLKAIGIEKVESFLNQPAAEDELDPYLLDNMEDGLRMFRHIIETKGKVHITIDCDPDGFTSSAIIHNYINTISPETEIVHYLHEGKEHGIVLEGLDESCDLYIVPDAGSNQQAELLKLADMDKKVLVLDHHEVDVEINHPNIIIINNQTSPRFTNKDLSGAGIVFKFVQAYDQLYMNGSLWDAYYDLASLGIISDMCYCGTLDNNSIIYKGLNNIYNRGFEAMLNKQAYSISSTLHPNKIDVAFYITPMMNGVIRWGTQEDKERLFEILCYNNIDRYVDTTFRGTERHETYYDFVARESGNVKSRQDTVIKKTAEALYEKIISTGMDKNKIIIYKTDLSNKEDVPKTITGLIAMKLVAYFNKPAMVIRPIMIDGVQYYQGSIRGKTADGFTSFKDFLTDSGLTEYVAGHANAAGIGIKEENIDALISYANEKLADIDFGSDTIEVCGINPNREPLFDFADHNYLYGNGIPECKVAFVGIDKKNYKTMGAKADTIKINIDGIDFIKFHAKDIIEQIENIDSDYYKYTIIGRPQINEYMGRKSLQIIIDAIEVEENGLI